MIELYGYGSFAHQDENRFLIIKLASESNGRAKY